MARYVDMGKLKEMIEAKADTLIEGKEAFLYVAKWLEVLPSADVAPRAEVARDIFEEIDDAMIDHAQGETTDHWLFVRIAELKKKYTEAKK